MKSSIWIALSAGTALVAAVACSKGQSTATETTSTATAAATQAAPAAVDAHAIFQQRFVACHGEDGKGDGPGAAALNPKPRNYTDVAWQNSVTDEHIKQTILYGGAAVGKSPNMPPNPDLDGKPELDGLVKVVREFKGK